MYRVEIIANQSVQDDIIEALEEYIPDILYTVIPLVHGRGKAGYKLGKVSIPKSWAYQGVGTEAHKNHKLYFRNRVKTLNNMMTVYYKDGSFYKVILTVSNSRTDDVWAVAPNGYDAGVSQDATSIEVVF